ncbi:Alpha/Beta hydrolase protein [Hyaloraphidium curvatum]|nr:Alpha/Beta hydrolase protein [Hyaloraphidium curvatum]
MLSSGVRLSYVDSGPFTPRDTVLLLPPFPEGPLAFRKLMPALVARGFRVIVPTLRGWAPGDPSPANADAATLDAFYSVKAQCIDLAELISVLGLPNAVVGGSNATVVMATHFALLFPHLVSRLLILSGPYHPPPENYVPLALLAVGADPTLGYKLYLASDRARIEFDADLPFMLKVFMRGGGPEEMELLHKLKSISGLAAVGPMVGFPVPPSPLLSQADEDMLVAHLESIGGCSGPLMWYRCEARTFKEFQGVPREIRCPVLFLTGAWNPLGAPGQRAEMRRLCADLNEITLPHVGTWISIEAPEEVAEAVSAWTGQPRRGSIGPPRSGSVGTFQGGSMQLHGGSHGWGSGCP